ncbi:MAG: HDIG domain-containing protein [Bacteroidales bacterium]|nr:HDIG domain-containing protein [Bacteroidales bacterium]
MRLFKESYASYLPSVSRVLLFLLSASVIVALFPREGKFKYEFRKGKPWMHDVLVAPFDFAILKTADEYEAEKTLLLERSHPYFVFDQKLTQARRQMLRTKVLSFLQILPADTAVPASDAVTYRKIMSVYDSLTSRGILEMNPVIETKPASFVLFAIRNNIAQERRLSSFFTIHTANEYIRSQTGNMSAGMQRQALSLLQESLVQTVRYNESMSKQATVDILESLSSTRGMVQEGEKIISRGELITLEKFQMLESLKSEFTNRLGSSQKFLAILAGQILLVALAMIVLAFFLYFFRRKIFYNHRKLSLILLVITLVISITSLVIRIQPAFLYLVPVCLVPVMMRVFFDTRVSLYVHIITIILVGFLVPNSFEFVFLQLIAGIITIFTIVNFERKDQLVITSLFVFISYTIVYIGMYLIHEGGLEGLKLNTLLMFAGSAILILLASPFIFLFEKTFGLVTDVTLLDLCNTNNKLLREFAARAPGSFHHSHQVATLAEAVVREIGGNPLLVKAGAMYHDIGKMELPAYFVENQTRETSAHEDLGPEESAAIIISHVERGVRRARKAKIPEQVIDFIRTHHGTRLTGYFYARYKTDTPVDEQDTNLFRYSGPRPFSKETCILMLTDSVEAASRSLKSLDPNTVNTLVDKIIDEQLSDHQFDQASITLRELTQARSILKKEIISINHMRVEYPG